MQNNRKRIVIWNAVCQPNVAFYQRHGYQILWETSVGVTTTKEEDDDDDGIQMYGMQWLYQEQNERMIL